MKRISIYIIILLIVFSISGCDKKATPMEDTTQSFQTGKPIDLSIYYYLFNMRDAVTRMSELEIKSWEDYLQNISGNNFDIKYIEAEHLPEDTTSINENRLVYISHVDQINILKEANLIIPLNDYLNQLDNVKLIPDEIIDSFTDTNGNIWALPTYWTSEFIYRRYDKEWLAELGCKIPTNIDELKEIGRKIKEQEKGEYHYLFDIRPPNYYSYIELMDIFMAFGCYPNLRGLPNVSYNANSNKYIDIALTPGFEEALTYLRYLIDEEMVFVTEWDYNVDNYKFLSGYLSAGGDYGYQLNGPNSTNTFSEIIFPQGIAVMRGTDDILNKLAFFSENAFVNEEIRTALFLGEKGYHYTEFENYYLMHYGKEKDPIVLTPIRINIFNGKRVFSKDIYDDRKTAEENKVFNENRNKVLDEYELMKSRVSDGVYYYNMLNRVKLDFGNSDIYEGYEQINKSIEFIIYEDFIALLEEVFYQQTTVEDALKLYAAKCNNSNYINFFADLNSHLN